MTAPHVLPLVVPLPVLGRLADRFLVLADLPSPTDEERAEMAAIECRLEAREAELWSEVSRLAGGARAGQ